MPKMYALKAVHIDREGGRIEVIARRKVFSATVEQAKQLDALKAARPATAAEISAAKEEVEKAEGTFFTGSAASEPEVVEKPPASGAANDPNTPPKRG